VIKPGGHFGFRKCEGRLAPAHGFFRHLNWWAVQGSNLRPLPCEGNALPLS
jgi:hypothetical protein